jgi:O-antigen/teichoic acid export membrane protein
MPDTSGPQTEGHHSMLFRLVAKNTAFNFFTQFGLAALAFLSIPFIVHRLPKDEFGLLMIVWAFIGYFTLLDFGISRAVTKFLSEELRTPERGRIQPLVWTSLTLTALIGIVTGLICYFLAPVIANRYLNLSPAAHQEAVWAFVIGAISIPFMLVFGTLKGFQMAMQRFDVMNMFQGAQGAFQWLGAVLLVMFGYGVKEIIGVTIVSRIFLTVLAFLVTPRFLPEFLTTMPIWNRLELRRLMKFGGWLTISQVVGPLFLYIDRLFIGIFMTMTAVTYYSVPQEAISRFLVIPVSLTATLFPALTYTRETAEGREMTGSVYHRSIKYLTILMIPLILVLVVNARFILEKWLGSDFAAESTLVFQICAIGLFFNAVTQIPYTALQAGGRPDLTAKFQLVELVIAVILNVILIHSIGILGAAITWTVRVVIDAALAFFGASHFLGFHLRTRQGTSGPPPVVGYSIAIGTFLLAFAIGDMKMRLCATALCCAIYLIAIWRYGLDENERIFFISMRKRVAV